MKEILDLIEKYFRAETSLEDEVKIKSYFNSGKEPDSNLDYYSPLFNALNEEGQVKFEKDLSSIVKLSDQSGGIEDLLGKYFEGTSDLEEELELSRSITDSGDSESAILFKAFEQERQIKSNLDEASFLELIKMEEQNKKPTPVIQLRKLLRYAAILLLPVALFFTLNYFQVSKQSNEIAYLDISVGNPENTEEAYALTKEALLLISEKMNKGKKQFNATLPHFEKTKIFK